MYDDDEPENVWQPIETAPKGPDPLLLFWPSYAYNLGDAGRSVIAIGQWKENDRTGQSYFADNDELDDYGLAEYGPTHWMPLPEPPTESGIIRSGVSGGEWSKLYALK